jgi:hypothetical protein
VSDILESEPGARSPEGEPAESDAGGAKEGKIRIGQPEGEIDGPRGPEPTRYGDWEKGGRCIDF